MTHLIKLELKKFGIAQNIIFMFAAILFSILFITISLWDSMTDPKQVKDTFESTYLVIGLLMSFIFLVYSSVLTAKLVIGEYNHRTITIMFSYPLNRIKLIASKLTIIMVYSQPISGCQRSLQRRAQACNAPVLLSSLTNRCAPSPTPGVYRTSLLRGSGQ